MIELYVQNVFVFTNLDGYQLTFYNSIDPLSIFLIPLKSTSKLFLK